MRCRHIFLFFLILLSLTYPVFGATDSFIDSEVSFESYAIGHTVQSGFDKVDNMSFKEISYYQTLYSIQVFYDSAGNFILDAGAPNGATTPMTIKDGITTIGTGNIGYGKVGADAINIYLYFDTWNIGALSGPKNLTIEADNTAIYNLTLRNWNPRPTSTNGIGLFWSNLTAIGYSGDYYIYHDAYWENSYTYSFVDPFYYLDITKVIGGKAYNSTWIVSNPTIELLNETGIPTASDISGLQSVSAPLTLSVYSNYDILHTATIFTPAAGAFEIAGSVFNAKNGFTLPGAVITLDSITYATSDESGQYSFTVDAGTYNLSCSLSGYETTFYNLTVDNNLVRPLPMSPEYDDTTIPPNTCVIYGVVLEKTTGIAINTARITADNGSEYSTYSNSLGYYEITGLIVDVYSLTGVKSGYYNSNYNVNTTALNTSTYQLIEMINPDLLTTPTPTPATTDEDKARGAFIDFFTMIGVPEESAGFVAGLLLILACIIVGYKVARTFGALMCGLVGFLFSVILGLIPMWLVVVFALIAVIAYIKMFYGGD